MSNSKLVSRRRFVAGSVSLLPRGTTAAAPVSPGIVVAPDASWTEQLAARELRRYFYLRTGVPASIQSSTQPPAGTDTILVGRKGRPWLGGVGEELKPSEFLLRTVSDGAGKRLLVTGGDDTGTLYAAYRLAEHIGVRFYLHGDVIPDDRIPPVLPQVDQIGKPLFSIRGVNPWGSHPFGFDQWSAGDYKVVVHQLAKLRLNFLGIHCYPEGLPYAEPTVWLGLGDDFDDHGTVRESYPANYYNTSFKGEWGPILPRKTGDYSFGGALLFERDDWGPDVMRDLCPAPRRPDECNALFNRVAEQFRDAFTFARRVNVKTCLGIETPLVMPGALRARLKARGKDSESPAAVREVYKAVFRRISAAHPLDYFWLWTPEGWTWRGNTPEELARTINDIKLALAAVAEAEVPFRIATSGWVLGPQNDRAALDGALPKSVPVSALSRSIGHDRVDRAFGCIKGRESWAIPWLEGDGDLGLAAVQLWAGRTRKDAMDARALGCTGLLGLHWRTDILSPGIAALAAGCWDQSGWQDEAPNALEGPVGGRSVVYPAQEVKGAADPVPYLSVRDGMEGYRFRIPPGTVRVTLQFCEPRFDRPGERVFDVKLQGRTAVESLDIFARAGKFAALNLTIEKVEVLDGWLHIEFVPRISVPCISGIVIAGGGFRRYVNCGGPNHHDYVADEACSERKVRVDDLYADFARAWFGPGAADEIGRIFARIDSRVPPSVVSACPSGSLTADPRPWTEASRDFAFVDEFAALCPRVTGAGNRERLSYWLNTFRYHRALAELRCLLGAFDAAMNRVAAEDASSRRALAEKLALPAYRQLLACCGRTYTWLLESVNSNGAIATVVNLENNAGFWPNIVEKPARRLSEALGGELPADAKPAPEYGGRPRIILPTVRTAVEAGRPLLLKPIVLAAKPPRRAVLRWRPLAGGRFREIPLAHVARGVFRVELPAQDAATTAVEYYIQVETAGQTKLVFPATAPLMNQTVVVLPAL